MQKKKHLTDWEVLPLYSRRYGKLTARAWLSRELENSHPFGMILAGSLCMLGGIILRGCAGAPYPVILELGIGELIPPAWIMALLWTVSFFTIGCAAGFVLCYRMAGRGEEKYKGSMLFLLLYAAELCWYPALFAARLVFFSTLLCFLILCISVWVTACFYRVTKLAGFLLLLHDVWLIYMLILSFAVLFHG